jgi:hypothetical protein
VWIDIHGNKMFKLQARTQVSIELKMWAWVKRG